MKKPIEHALVDIDEKIGCTKPGIKNLSNNLHPYMVKSSRTPYEIANFAIKNNLHYITSAVNIHPPHFNSYVRNGLAFGFKPFYRSICPTVSGGFRFPKNIGNPVDLLRFVKSEVSKERMLGPLTLNEVGALFNWRFSVPRILQIDKDTDSQSDCW